MIHAPEPLRVLWLYHLADPTVGPFRSLIDIADRRDRAAFRITAALPGPGQAMDQLAARDIRSVKHVPQAGESSLRFVRAVWAFARLLRRERTELVYLCDYVMWRSAELTAAALLGVPYVVHIRSPLAEGARDPRLLGATAVIGNSRASIRALEGRLPPDRLHVVYNFIDFDRFTKARDIRHLFFPERPPVVGFVGFFRPEKGIEYFLDAAALIARRRPDVRFLAVGGPSSTVHHGWLTKMQEHATSIGVHDRVHFTGQRDDVPDLMRSMDVLVVPSFDEGFGRVIIEANAVGVPVVGANAAGIPEVVEEGVTGRLVPARDADAIAAAVLAILDDAEWRRRVATEVPGRVRERFSPDVSIRRIEAVWRQAAGREVASAELSA